MIVSCRSRSLVIVALLGIALQAAAAISAPRSDAGADFVVMPDGVRLFTRTVGRGGETVVMLHGGPASDMESSLRDLAPLARGRTLLFYDQRGGGRSGPVADLASVTAGQHVRDLEDLRRHFGLERLTLFGHSWGAGLAMLYAMEHPDRVQRVVLVAPLWPRWSPYAGQYQTTLRDRLGRTDYARFQTLADRMESTPDPTQFCREFFQLFLRAAGTTADGLRRVHGDPCTAEPEVTRTYFVRNRVTIASLGDYDWRSRAARVDAPTLVVHGTRDVLTEAASREWAATLPNSRLLRIPGAGHLPYADQPQAFYSAVGEFLSGRWPRESRRIDSPG
jgi:proline iminopeptidase